MLEVVASNSPKPHLHKAWQRDLAAHGLGFIGFIGFWVFWKRDLAANGLGLINL